MAGTVFRFASGMIRQGVPAAELRPMADLFTRNASSSVCSSSWTGMVANRRPASRR